MSAFEGRHAACCGAMRGEFSPAGTQRKYERSRPFVVTHLALDLDVDFERRGIAGIATLDFSRRAASGTSLDLDAVALRIAGVLLDDGSARALELIEGTDYSYDGSTLSIAIPSSSNSGRVVVKYTATPRAGLYFLSPDKENPDRPRQVWSQCQDEDGRYWFPCQDKPHVKMTTEMRVTVPAGMQVLSGGRLVGRETAEDAPSWTYHYALDVPTPAYLLTLVVGQFDEWREEVELDSGRVIPLRYLVPAGKIADGKRAFSETARMLRLFSRVTGVEYPWDRYSQVVVDEFIFGGMENTTATTMYEHILLDERAALDIESHDLVAHELAHQWFGDLVTCRDWSHAWLNEGFATYFELVEREDRLGPDEYDEALTADLSAYLGEAGGSYQRPIVCRDYVEPIDLFDRHLYQKGGCVLHMLRRRIGDEAFYSGIKSYLEEHRGTIVETTDLVRALEEASGESLEKFFDQWVYRAGHPELDVKISYEAGLTIVDVEQTQKGDGAAVFELPIEIELEVNGQTTRHQRTLDARKGTLVVRTEARPNLVVFDPDYQVVAPVKLTLPRDLTVTQLERGPSARARKVAAELLGKKHDPEAVAALVRCLEAEGSWIVRAAAAKSLGRLLGDESLEALLTARSTAHPKVRRAVATALGRFRKKSAYKSLVKLLDDDSYLVAAAAARALGESSHPDARKLLAKQLDRSSWAEVIRAGALDGLARAGDEDATPSLIEWTRYGKPLRARRAAIAALPKLATGKKVERCLTELLEDHDVHTRVAALGALEALGSPTTRSAIGELLERELDGRVLRRARATLAGLGDDGKLGLKKAREETQRLERELTELKLRLAKLEQAQKPKEPKADQARANESPSEAAESDAASAAQPEKAASRRAASGKAEAATAKKKALEKPGSRKKSPAPKSPVASPEKSKAKTPPSRKPSAKTTEAKPRTDKPGSSKQTRATRKGKRASRR